MNDISFSVNTYDHDGDLIDNCILLHLSNNTILRVENLDELENMIEQLYNIKVEIEQNY